MTETYENQIGRSKPQRVKMVSLKESLRHGHIETGGVQWCTEVTIIIWTYILRTWESCNGDNHGRTAEQKERQAKRKLQRQIRGIFQMKDKLPPVAYDYLYKIPIAELMKRSVGQLQRWLHLAQPYAKQQQKAFKEQQKHGVQDIRAFYNARPRDPPDNDSTTKRPP